MTVTPSLSHDGRRSRSYIVVFLVLAAITALELMMKQVGLPASMANALFLAFSLAKAALVAMFFMHLRQDSRIYTGIFLLPVIMVLAFSSLMLVSAGGH